MASRPLRLNKSVIYYSFAGGSENTSQLVDERPESIFLVYDYYYLEKWNLKSEAYTIITDNDEFLSLSANKPNVNKQLNCFTNHF